MRSSLKEENTVKAIQISKAGGALELVERETPAVRRDWVRIKVQACGVCHSDMLMKEGYWPGLQYPRVPGLEVAGMIDEVGDNVTAWKKGQRIGVGYRTVPIGRGNNAKDLALKRGEQAYVNSEAANPVEELKRIGGAKVILSTAPAAKRWPRS